METKTNEHDKSDLQIKRTSANLCEPNGRLMTPAEVMEYLSIGKTKFYEIKDTIPCVFVDPEKKIRRYRKESLDQWLAVQ